MLTKTSTKFPGINSAGHIIPMEVAVRISDQIQNSFKLITSIRVKNPAKDEFILLLDEDGRITELTYPATSFFVKGDMINIYNKEFQEINDVIFSLI